MNCNICLDDNNTWAMISPCKCSGSVGNVHFYCLLKWLWTSKTSSCSICKTDLKNKELWSIVSTLSMICELLLEFAFLLYQILNECLFRR